MSRMEFQTKRVIQFENTVGVESMQVTQSMNSENPEPGPAPGGKAKEAEHMVQDLLSYAASHTHKTSPR